MARQSITKGDIAKGQCANLAELENLNEETLLEELNLRYMNDVIYTYVGEILVAVNPYKMIDGIYSKSKQNQYRNGVDKTSIPPHIYAVADNAFEALKNTRKDQVCVISGESGAGKTESAKLFLKHIVDLSPGTESQGLENRIIGVNPLLEAFGNAQTLMNDNSSRFGKYLDLRFNENLEVKGAIITEYLLEKSRVVHQADGEQNFHIFYYLFAGLSPEQKQQFELRDPGEYRFLCENEHALQYIKTAECKKMWDEVYSCMDLVGFTQIEKDGLFALLSGVLLLGDIEYVGDEAASVSSESNILTSACHQLGIDPETTELALTTLVTITRGEEIIRTYKVEQAEDCRDATAKALYGRAFTWIVKRINALLGPKDKSIGMRVSFLDIFGFECFDENSFEQLCINLANEQLQFFFNNHIFAMELAEYAKEGIDGSNITYEDNQPVLDLILSRKPPGLLMILDEESSFPKATDGTLVGKFHGSFSKSKDYEKPKGNEDVFSVKHYAGVVRYDAFGFLEKNRDNLAVDIQAIMRVSENNCVREIFGADAEDAKAAKGNRKKVRNRGKGNMGKSRQSMRMSMKKVNASLARKKKMTVGSAFKDSLAALMVNLNASAPHFIRCIKPNSVKAALNYDDVLVTKQLRYTGMLETTRIRREGYAVRPGFADFVARYKPLGFYLSADVPASASSCQRILTKSGVTGWLLGKTKVFMKYFHLDELNDKLRPIKGAAITIQRHARGFTARSKYARILAAKRAQDKLVEAFMNQTQRNCNASRDVVLSLCEEDAKRPADFWSKPKEAIAAAPPKVESGTAKRKKAGFKRAASVKWFKEVEMAKGSAVSDEGGFAAWFHGIISRAQSEELLLPLTDGAFLVRVSESRFGYSLSFKFKGRIKHFMIDQTPDGKYLVVGNDRVFPGLNELVLFHQTHPLTDDGDVLTIACQQKSDLSEFM